MSGSKTGTYVWDPVERRLVKISEKPGAMPPVDVFVPRGGYWDEHLGRMIGGRWVPEFVDSREKKARRMKELGIVEDGGFKVSPGRKWFV